MRICTGGRRKEKDRGGGQGGREKERHRESLPSEDFPVAGSSPL